MMLKVSKSCVCVCHVIHSVIHSEVSVVIFIMGTHIHYKIQKFPVVCGS